MRVIELDDALTEYRQGRELILVRDEEHTAEGFLLLAAESASAAAIERMYRHGPGILGLAATSERLEDLGLAPTPEPQRAAPFGSAGGPGGRRRAAPAVAAQAAEADASVVRALAHPATRPGEVTLPPHILPLEAARGGVLSCATAVEAAIDLARLSGLRPMGLVCGVGDGGGRGRGKTDSALLQRLAGEDGLSAVSLASLIARRRQDQAQVELICLPQPVRLPTRYGLFNALVFSEPLTGVQHLALVHGDIAGGQPVLTRLHSECLTGDTLGSSRCDCGSQLELGLKRIAEAECGVLLYLRQEGRGIGLYNKLLTYTLQEQGLDTVEANEQLGFPPDSRDYGTAARILLHLGVRQVRLLTNNPQKIRALDDRGLQVVERVALEIPSSPDNRFYLRTKRERMHHLLLEDEGEREPGGSDVTTVAPPERFVILTTPRTGSNWLCSLLGSHREVLCHHELFNPERIIYTRAWPGGALDLGTQEERDRDALGFLERVWERRCGRRVVGFKLNRGQSEAVLQKVLADRSIRKIVLRRRNRVRTFVSEKLAQLTGEWESYPESARGGRPVRLVVDVAELRAHAAENERYFGRLLLALRESGQDHLELTYEELCGAEERRRVLRFLGVATDRELVGETRQQHAEPLRDLISNYDELAAALRGSDLEAELQAPSL
jgi:3,4-dihydroxy 2-butanone 4-phosphate synthase/GTP cyclohydrolase II